MQKNAMIQSYYHFFIPMFYYYRFCRRFSRLFNRLFLVFILLILLNYLWTNLSHETHQRNISPKIFCFVLTENKNHLTLSRSVVYTWGKQCDRFYFITRLLNTSTELMMLPKFENTTDVTERMINRITFDVLLHLRDEIFASSYHWFLRASDTSFVIMPNLRRLLSQLEEQENHRPYIHIGDAEKVFDQHQLPSIGSVMLFNRHALNEMHSYFSNDRNDDKEHCVGNMIYDHEFIKCLKRVQIQMNSQDENLILSQPLPNYRMDRRLKVSNVRLFFSQLSFFFRLGHLLQSEYNRCSSV